MSLLTYGPSVPIVPLATCSWPPSGPRPGDWVTHSENGGRGIIVGRLEDPPRLIVLWSIDPDSGLQRFTFPSISRVVSPSFIAKQLVSVQPMTLSSGKVFYIDYTYGVSGSKDPA